MYTSAKKVTHLFCVTLILLAMQGAFSATRTITGWVVDEQGKPVTQGEVACFPPAGDV